MTTFKHPNMNDHHITSRSVPPLYCLFLHIICTLVTLLQNYTERYTEQLSSPAHFSVSSFNNNKKENKVVARNGW